MKTIQIILSILGLVVSTGMVMLSIMEGVLSFYILSTLSCCVFTITSISLVTQKEHTR